MANQFNSAGYSVGSARAHAVPFFNRGAQTNDHTIDPSAMGIYAAYEIRYTSGAISRSMEPTSV